MCDKIKDEHTNMYECPVCKYVSNKTVLIIFEHKEYRFCLKCWLKFMTDNIPPAILLNDSSKVA